MFKELQKTIMAKPNRLSLPIPFTQSGDIRSTIRNKC